MEQAAKREAAKRHILISGTGRSGTTLLVQFFTALGLDTGYSLDEAKAKVNPISQAGLEPDLHRDDLPHVVKSPWLADKVEQFLEREDITIEAAIVPVRDLFSVAESRRRVFYEASKVSRKPQRYAGSLWKTDDPAQQELFLSLQFYRFLYPIITHDVPLYFLHFPRFVEDPDYLYSVLSPLLDTYDVDSAGVSEALSKVARPELINQFPAKERPAPPQPQKTKVLRALSSLSRIRARVGRK